MRKAQLIGNLGRDAEMGHTKDGKTMARFSVAAKAGKDDSQWHSCTLFGRRAEALAQYLTKGQKVFIGGSFDLRQWEKNGRAGAEVSVTVDEIELLGSKQSKDDDPFNI